MIAAWQITKESILSFIDDEALSRGAAISFYTATSIAPVLLIVIAVAGLAVGREATMQVGCGLSRIWVLEAHKGYPVPEHLAAIERLGVSAIHRRSLAPIRSVSAPLPPWPKTVAVSESIEKLKQLSRPGLLD